MSQDNPDQLRRLKDLNHQLIALLESRGIDWRSELGHAAHTRPLQNATDNVQTSTTAAAPAAATAVTHAATLTTEQKISIFRSLFRGRTDVYPIRWENNAGRSGYSPACHNEWKPNVCGKPAIKCSQCPNQSWESVTDRVIYDHLAGKHVIGVYPMVDNDQCHFLAVDFDEGNWQADATAFRHSCEELHIPCAIEISRSGNGAHAWIFFSEPVSARQARNLGAAIISYTCAGSAPHHRQLKLSSYDRMFPNQDTLPKVSRSSAPATLGATSSSSTRAAAGLGNLIALPLQKHPRNLGRSVFANADLIPYPDQWAYLASIKPLSAPSNQEIDGHITPSMLITKPGNNDALNLAEHIDNLIQQAVGSSNPLDIGHFTLEAFDPDAPWQQQTMLRDTDSSISPTSPASFLSTTTVTLTLSNLIYLPKAELSPQLLNRLVRITAFQNPEYYKAQALRLPVWNKPKIITCAENFPNHIGLPRGCLDAVIELLAQHNIHGSIEDKRQNGRPLLAAGAYRGGSEAKPQSQSERRSRSQQRSIQSDKSKARRTVTNTSNNTNSNTNTASESKNQPSAPSLITFRGKLRPEQTKAVKAMTVHDNGVLCAPTAFGKTVTAAALIAKRGASTLILVHRTELLEQWKERLCGFLGLEAGDIGIIGGGKKAKKDKTKMSQSAAVNVETQLPHSSAQSEPVNETLIDIAMVQSLVRQGNVNPIVEQYGHVIIDECHHVSAVSFEQIMKTVKARYVLGLTATPIRRDGLQPIIMMQCGPIRHRATRAQSTQASLTVQAYEVDISGSTAETANDTSPATDTDQPIQAVFQELAQDKARTELIVKQTMVQFRHGRKVLLLTERPDHLLKMETMIRERMATSSQTKAQDESLEGLERSQRLQGPQRPSEPAASEPDCFFVLHGRMKKSDRASVLERLQSLPPESPRILLATGKLIGEGFDHAPLDTLALAMPISWKGTLQQYVGRLHREHASKTNILVIDFVDQSHPSLLRMWKKRQAGYKAMGYEIRRLIHEMHAITSADSQCNNSNLEHTEDGGRPPSKQSRRTPLKDQGKLDI